jgi:hypothetical protein
MTLFSCSMHGVQPSGRPWSLRIGVVSASSVTTVEGVWATSVTSAWTDATHGLQTLFPAGTTIGLTKTEQLHVVTIGTVDKLRVNGIAQDPLALVGTSANASLPEQNAILVPLRTATPGREGRGRVHLPAPDETLVTAGELGSTPATRVSTAMEALRAAMAGAGHVPSLITYVKPLTGTPVGTTKGIVLVETDRVIRTVRIRNKSRAAVYV